ncbi:unnamed protein product [Prorocentrum cordatum]|uniref:PPIase cyclophilin-type domain-containing protein n=1 Tax=Prorocentrum cordatum TaxID=2364126 RepID=A0ABN9SPD5_9DINO|nr:unnamed protein product [Polarella glacialis]
MNAHPKDLEFRSKVMRWGQRKGISLDVLDRLLLLPKPEIDSILQAYVPPGDRGDGVALEASEDSTFDVVFDVALHGDSQETRAAHEENASFTVRVHPDWAPLGAAHFRKLVEQGWYNDAGVFRVVEGFVAQFGLPARPQPDMQKIADDRVLGDGMAVADRFFSGYGENPSQGRIKREGNAYLDNFPKMTKFTKVSIKGQPAEPEAEKAPPAPAPSAAQAAAPGAGQADARGGAAAAAAEQVPEKVPDVAAVAPPPLKSGGRSWLCASAARWVLAGWLLWLL